MMATKHIADAEVCRAVHDSRSAQWTVGYAYTILSRTTGQPMKVCYRAMERANRRGLLDYGVSLRTAWLTPAGRALIGIASE